MAGLTTLLELIGSLGKSVKDTVDPSDASIVRWMQANGLYLVSDPTLADGQPHPLRVDSTGKLLAVAAASVSAGTPVLYRSAVTGADVLAAVGTVTCTAPGTAGGTLLNVAYTLGVIAGRTNYGRTPQTAGNTTVTPTANQRIRMAWAQVANADFYDLYAGAAGAPLWLGRVTEAQRATGGLMDTLNTYGAGGVAGAIDIGVAGTGLAPSLQVQNTAYLPDHLSGTPTPLGTGKQYVDVDLVCTRTGDGAALALTVVPFLENTVSGYWAACRPIPIVFGGAASVYDAQTPRLRIPNQGQRLHVAVAALSGTGASVDLYEIPS